MSAKLYTCPKCGEDKPKSAYYPDKRVPSGIRASECKACYSARKRAKTVRPAKPLTRSATQLFWDWIKGRK